VKPRHAREARAAELISRAIRPLPRSWALALGRGLGRLLADLDRRHVAIAVDNLRHALPHWDESRLYCTARGVYAHFGAVLVDLLWLEGRTPEQWLALTDVEGAEHVLAAQQAGRGILYPTGHFGHWEAHAICHAWRFAPIGVVARALDNPALDARLCALRTRSGSAVIYKQKALANVLRTLREGRGVAILMDQNVQAGDGIFVDFFGRKAATTTVVAALAVKTGCAVVPVRSELTPRGRIRCVYEAPVRWQPSGDRAADVQRLTQALTWRIEGWIRERPGQWLWIHRRWKTRPADEPPRHPEGAPPVEGQSRHPEGAPRAIAPEGSGVTG
jgi:KDO2-lipid IV(A) lauroyltransferase